MAGTVLNDNAAELQEEITEVLLPANQKMTSGAFFVLLQKNEKNGGF